MVAEDGLEPSRCRQHRILNPACLPIPPLGHDFYKEIGIAKIGSPIIGNFSDLTSFFSCFYTGLACLECSGR